MDSEAAAAATPTVPLSHKIWAWLDANRAQALQGAAGLIVLGIIIAFFFWRAGEKEIKAGEALSNVSVLMPGRPEAAEAYLKVAAEYSKSSAGAQAMLLGASSLFVNGNYPAAKEQFEKFLREHHDSGFQGYALLGIAASLDAQNKPNEAIAAYKNLVERHPSELAVPQAKFALARLYENTDKPELARPIYEELNRTDPSGSIGSEAGMRLEELMIKYPNLVPPPPKPITAQPGPLLPTLEATPSTSAPPGMTVTNTTIVTPATPTPTPANTVPATPTVILPTNTPARTNSP